MHIKLTIRRLLRDKTYLAVNVLSLCVGLICCLYVFRYVQHELSYDRFHEDADSVYRIEYEMITQEGDMVRFANLHGNIAPNWLPSVSEIIAQTRFAPFGTLAIEVNGELFSEEHLLSAENTFFNIFSFPLLDGNSETVLTEPNSIVIDESTAWKYFNTTDAVGEVITVRFLEEEELLTITGVMQDVSQHSHFTFGMVTSADVYEKLYGHNLDDIQQGYNYIKVVEGTSSNQLERTLNEIHARQHPENAVSFRLQALTDIHLHSSARGELSANGNAATLFVMVFIALIILLIAGVNFTTLAIARSVNRSNEIGVRKVYGARKMNLISAFLFEGVILSLLALLLAFILAWQFLPQFNSLSGQAITAAQLTEPAFLLNMIVIAVITGSLAAVYPMLIMVNKKPVSLLSGRSSSGVKKGTFWKGVVVLQMAVTIILIFAGYVVYKQVNFIYGKELGFSKEQVVTLPNYFGENPETFLNRLRGLPDIETVTISSYIPGVSKTSGFAQVTAEGRTDTLTFDWISVDPQYLSTYDIRLKEGRNFLSGRASDASQAFIINETAVKNLGLEEPVGKRIEALGREGEVIGVVEDFHFLSLHNEVSPLVMAIYEPFYWTISAKIQSGSRISETIAGIETIWQDMLPGTPFMYDFVDDRFAAVYENEQRMQNLFTAFSVLAVIIAMLGLFSFAAFSIRQRTKEISIRKVLGATVSDILKLFYSGYAKLLMIAALIALPLGFVWMRLWLQNFSYKTEIGPDVFGVPLIFVLIILMLSVSRQVVKGASRNPADSIRVE